MCVLLKYVFFDFASDAILKDSANVLRFFSALHDGGEFRRRRRRRSHPNAGAPERRKRPRNAWLRFENAASSA
jgi:hypothetical protein